jgi:glycosyltransferase involved in cell wall biosynthesis
MSELSDTYFNNLAPGYSIVIPVYNEEALIERNSIRLLNHLKSLNLGLPFEIIISSNGSTDMTVRLGRELSRLHKEIVFLAVPQRGPGLSFRQAVTHASYSNMISFDMDLSVDLGFIDEAARHLAANTIVIGSKRIGNQQRSFLRKIPSTVFIELTRILLGMSHTDYSMAAKAYKTEFLRDNIRFIDPGTSYVINMIYLAKRNNLRTVEIPVDCNDNRKSRFNIVQMSCDLFVKLMRIWWNLKIKGGR